MENTHPIVHVEGVSYRYPASRSASQGEAGFHLRDMSFQVAPGEIVCLVGASGCGKTTLLRLIAGLKAPAAGTIRFNTKVMAGDGVMIPAEHRRVGLVFQNQSLFPHLTVAKNIAFGISHLSRSAQQKRVEELLAMIQMQSYADRYPHELSGGQQQRVAIMRALAPSPDVMLMDEPFASLDHTHRAALRDEIRQVMKTTGVPTIIISHDADEALVLGDRILVMERGRLVQMDTPERVYYLPRTVEIGALFGEINAVPVTVKGRKITTPFGVMKNLHHFPDGKAILPLRPELLKLSKGKSMFKGGRKCTLTAQQFFGSYYHYTAETDNVSYIVLCTDQRELHSDTLTLSLNHTLLDTIS